jgi:hypothetical protein
MKKIELNGANYALDERIADFVISEKPSSNVAFFGTEPVSNKLFIQFKNGSTYIYSDVDSETLKQIHECESIGKFVASHVVKQGFPSEKIATPLVKPESAVDDEFELDMFAKNGITNIQMGSRSYKVAPPSRGEANEPEF